MYHYVYRITNKQLNKHYYGVRTTKIQPKDDLGHKYFSSSRDKDFITDQKTNPMNYRYKVVKIFNKRDDATQYEVLLHEMFDVGVNESFYNRSKQTAVGFDRTGIPSWCNGLTNLGGYKLKLTPEQRLERSMRQMGQKNAMYGKEPWQKGKKFTDESKDKMRKTIGDSRKGHKHSLYGVAMNDDTKMKISNSLIGFRHDDRECPHCKKIGRGPNMTRYHFDNCKLKEKKEYNEFIDIN